MSTTEATQEPEASPAAVQADEQSKPATHGRLAELVAKATAEYAVKHYSEAAELYSQASEIQAELNGEMALENADLYYSYGKCLFFLAQQTSSVLGGTATSAQLSRSKEKKASKKRNANGARRAGQTTDEVAAGESSKTLEPLAEGPLPNVGDVVREEDVKPEEKPSDKPLFQISGDDENWDDSDDDEEEEQDEEAAGEEDDDFANAYELLDLARVLYLKKLDQTQESVLEESAKGKYVPSIDLTPEVKALKARVADIYDLQSEVSLEGEKYSAAVNDLKACLALREELEPPYSSILAECHYKLSLALEFAAQTQQRDADGNPTEELQVDWDIRNEAIAQQEKAIEVCELRIHRESAALDKMEDGAEKDKVRAHIEDVQSMVGDMEDRLSELRKPPVSVKAETESEMKEQISGILGNILGSGASEEERKAKLEQVSEKANDLTGLVKRKKPKNAQADGGQSGSGSAVSTPAAVSAVGEASGCGSTNTANKRKVGFVDEVEDGDSGKKAKLEGAGS
ncbi:hypothetical protein HRR83_000788 [Exophiala dermatitidis]|nr:hypothetical protein HRR75_000713 [Exophiala dermatitidis]KAJ4528037.1 hypothetical protein HRR74_000792 [Exophiala dermatitidis]KAJ4553010.1 hypothetical protein HRR78_003269 [Exophiala dermatitidis]KAJ4581160.1 hypothetical protein HRR79_000207 [Exophiala dermatitidis]KAJ4608564.1 hypothetical protein HRR83_000788 [Exophiala dermatitidis]